MNLSLSYELHVQKLTEDETKLRDGIFNLETIRFGKIPEIMIKKKYGYSFPKGTTAYDLISESGDKIEVKFSCVREKETDITEDNVLNVCLENSEVRIDRKVSSEVYQSVNFDCNIQQVKPDLFKILYYGLFFGDRIAVFKMKADDMKLFFTSKYFSSSVRKVMQIEKKLNEVKGKFICFAGGKRDEEYILKRLEIDIPCLFSRIYEDLRKIMDDERKSYRGAKSIISDADLLKNISKTKKYISDSSKKVSRRISKCNQLLEMLREKLVIDSIPDSSAKQHLKSDGEGQFHIKNTNLDWHLNSKYFLEWITYGDLYSLLENKED